MSDANKLIGLRPDGSFHELDNEYKAIRWFIGNAFDFLKRGEGENALGMYIDDEGLITEGLVLNLAASLLAQYPVFGSAIITHAETDHEGNTLPPTRRIRNVAEGFAATVQALYLNAADVGVDMTIHNSPGTVPPPQVIGLSKEEAAAFFGWGSSEG